jgi:hypothetical protein
MVAVLDFVQGGVEFSLKLLGHPEAEELRDRVGGYAP